MIAGVISAIPTFAGTLAVPNSYFELPDTDFAGPRIDSWQKSPEPAWYQGGDDFPWDQTMGVFQNTAPGTTNHIDNIEGGQGAFLFALPDVAISQDIIPLAGTNRATFEVGRSYALTVAALGGGGGMSNGATLEIALYYLDSSTNRVTVAASTITNTAVLFPTNTHLLDFQVRTPTVRSTNAWAGQNIGVRIASTIGFELRGGYWDVDNVRLTESVVRNGSFESPDTGFADPRIDAWQKSPEPAWYQDGDEFPWEQLTGQFLNTPPGASNHIDNIDGEQGAFIFAYPDVALFQQLEPVSETNMNPAAFTGRYEVGQAYSLTVGVLGGGGGMSNGATFEISFYFPDAAGNQVPAAALTITNSPTLFPTNTHLTDFQLTLAPVTTNDPWAGKPIGIRLASTTTFDLQGGYWDVDNVRLESVQPAILLDSVLTNGQFRVTLESSPGTFEILTSTNIAAPVSTWTSLGTLTNTTGRVSFTDTDSSFGYRFYQVRLAP